VTERPVALPPVIERSASVLENLSEKIRECYRHAEDCERQGKIQPDLALRKDFFDTAERWIKLAHSYESTERLQRFPSKLKR
jgi:hypothetical protein